MKPKKKNENDDRHISSLSLEKVGLATERSYVFAIQKAVGCHKMATEIFAAFAREGAIECVTTVGIYPKLPAYKVAFEMKIKI